MDRPLQSFLVGMWVPRELCSGLTALGFLNGLRFRVQGLGGWGPLGLSSPCWMWLQELN